jgi:hypothetical protein
MARSSTRSPKEKREGFPASRALTRSEFESHMREWKRGWAELEQAAKELDAEQAAKAPQPMDSTQPNCENEPNPT